MPPRSCPVLLPYSRTQRLVRRPAGQQMQKRGHHWARQGKPGRPDGQWRTSPATNAEPHGRLTQCTRSRHSTRSPGTRRSAPGRPCTRGTRSWRTGRRVGLGLGGLASALLGGVPEMQYARGTHAAEAARVRVAGALGHCSCGRSVVRGAEEGSSVRVWGRQWWFVKAAATR